MKKIVLSLCFLFFMSCVGTCEENRDTKCFNCMSRCNQTNDVQHCICTAPECVVNCASEFLNEFCESNPNQDGGVSNYDGGQDTCFQDCLDGEVFLNLCNKDNNCCWTTCNY